MHLKEGVSVTGARPELLIGLMAAEAVYAEHQTPLVITSLNDSAHSQTSLHYAGAAADLRTRNLPDHVNPADVAAAIKSRLGIDYDVLFEGDHIHLEWQPRRR